jgi:predicted nucleic acid-binding protein
VIVTDAHQLVYLYVRGGALTDRVDAVYRRDGDWAAPYLWRSEVRNALARMIRDRKITMDEACQVASPDVLALAIQSGCTAYDCEYVALAEALDVPLVTEDREVLRAFPARAVSPEEFVTNG